MKYRPQTKEELEMLIRYKIYIMGPNCDLNDIDVSNIRDKSYLFCGYNFNGDISKWNVSNVVDMSGMFSHSKFNGNISKWDVSHAAPIRTFVNTVKDLFREDSLDNPPPEWNEKKLISALIQ